MNYYTNLLSFLITLQFAFANSPLFDELRIYEGGGFTGMYTGFIIDGKGKVYQCEGKGDCSKSIFVKSLTKKQIRELEKIVRKNSLFEIEYKMPHNVSRYIVITKGSKKITLVWNPFAQDSTSRKLTEIYSQIYGFVEQ